MIDRWLPVCRRWRCGLAVGLALLLAASTGAQETADAADDAAETRRDEPRRSTLTEEVSVNLMEVRVRITDRLGNPVRDIQPAEVSLTQGGREQQIAYLEAVMEREIHASEPVQLYDGSGAPIESESVVVVPPKQQRRLVLAFDPKNSRSRVREGWREAAIEWVQLHMREDDMASVVVLRPYTDWLLRGSSDKASVINALRVMNLFTDVPNRDRRSEMSGYLNDMRMLCVDTTESKVSAGRTNVDAQRGADLDSASLNCAFSLAQPLVREWSIQSGESYDGIQALAGELAAIPGEKAVVLFSEGMVDDAATMATNAMLNVFGFGVVDQTAMQTRLQRTELNRLGELYRRAAASGVAFFTIDTRHAAEGSSFFDLENNTASSTQNYGIDPYREMYESTRSTLAGLAYSTGGRPFYGPDDLRDKIAQAADSFFGIYTLGYYVAEGTDPTDRIRIKLKRKRIKVDYDKRPGTVPHRPTPLGMDLAIGKPTVTGDDLQSLPIAVMVEGDLIPFRKQGGMWGVELGLFVQAARPDGTVSDEIFEQVTIVLDSEQYRSREAQRLRHVVNLSLPAGPVRIRARLSDDRQNRLGDRSIDVTMVTGGGVVGGLRSPSDSPVAAAAGPGD